MDIRRSSFVTVVGRVGFNGIMLGRRCGEDLGNRYNVQQVQHVAIVRCQTGIVYILEPWNRVGARVST